MPEQFVSLLFAIENRIIDVEEEHEIFIDEDLSLFGLLKPAFGNRFKVVASSDEPYVVTSKLPFDQFVVNISSGLIVRKRPERNILIVPITDSKGNTRNFKVANYEG